MSDLRERAEKAAEKYQDWTAFEAGIRCYLAGHASRDEEVREKTEALERFIAFEDRCIEKYGDGYLVDNPKFKSVVDHGRTVIEKWKGESGV